MDAFDEDEILGEMDNNGQIVDEALLDELPDGLLDKYKSNERDDNNQPSTSAVCFAKKESYDILKDKAQDNIGGIPSLEKENEEDNNLNGNGDHEEQNSEHRELQEGAEPGQLNEDNGNLQEEADFENQSEGVEANQEVNEDAVSGDEEDDLNSRANDRDDSGSDEEVLKLEFEKDGESDDEENERQEQSSTSNYAAYCQQLNGEGLVFADDNENGGMDDNDSDIVILSDNIIQRSEVPDWAEERFNRIIELLEENKSQIVNKIRKEVNETSALPSVLNLRMSHITYDQEEGDLEKFSLVIDNNIQHIVNSQGPSRKRRRIEEIDLTNEFSDEEDNELQGEGEEQQNEIEEERQIDETEDAMCGENGSIDKTGESSDAMEQVDDHIEQVEAVKAYDKE